VKDTIFFGPSGQLTVVFDINAGYSLVDPTTSADPAQWTVTFNHTVYQGSEFEFDGGVELTILFGDSGSDPGPNVLNYAAGPSDIEDTQGRMLGAVVNFPL